MLSLGKRNAYFLPQKVLVIIFKVPKNVKGIATKLSNLLTFFKLLLFLVEDLSMMLNLSVIEFAARKYIFFWKYYFHLQM